MARRKDNTTEIINVCTNASCPYKQDAGHYYPTRSEMCTRITSCGYRVVNVCVEMEDWRRRTVEFDIRARALCKEGFFVAPSIRDISEGRGILDMGGVPMIFIHFEPAFKLQNLFCTEAVQGANLVYAPAESFVRLRPWLPAMPGTPIDYIEIERPKREKHG